MKHVTCEDENDALSILKGLSKTIGELDVGAHLSESQLRNLIRSCNGVTKWARGALSNVQKGLTNEPA